MKKYILSILVLSIIGAAISSVLMYQYFFPHSNFAMAACGSGLENPCAVLSQSRYAALFGLPIAGYGLMGYLILVVTDAVAIMAGEKWNIPCFAIQLPVAAASVITDVILGSILIYLKLSCRLCIATYIINILVCVSLFIWYLGIKDEGKGLRSIYRNLRSFTREPQNRPVAVCFIFIVLFMALFVFSVSAYMNIKGFQSELPAGEAEKFEEYYYSIRQEDITLPESAMSLGDPSAQIRVIVFTDFLCTACMKFYEAEKFLMSRFPGKIRIDYYSFPLDTVCNRHIPNTVYPNSCVAAQTFCAAARRGIFKDFLDYHYGHYRDNLSRFRSGDVLVGSKGYFKDHSSNEEYEIFLKEVLSEQAKLSLYDDVAQGGKLKVRAVPTLFINGRRIEGVPDARLLEFVMSRKLREK